MHPQDRRASQAFTPVGDRLLLDHLQGRHVMGVYPLLEDDTCWFLAADFDKVSWKDDVAAFGETCRCLGIPVAIDRSRSGNGAHAWFFFVAPVPANVARRMGYYALTETMSRRHELSMESYSAERLMPVIMAMLRSPQFRKFALGVVLVLADLVATELGRKEAR